MQAIPYVPRRLVTPARLSDAPTAWHPCESILEDLFERFGVDRSGTALELGVDWSFSTVALSNYFSHLIAVDMFTGGDEHAGWRGDDQYPTVSGQLREIPNVTLVRMDCREWMKVSSRTYSFVHCDLVHTYDLTKEVGLWAVKCCPLVGFHDTISHPDVRRAVSEICDATGKKFYEFQVEQGLGIVTDREIL